MKFFRLSFILLFALYFPSYSGLFGQLVGYDPSIPDNFNGTYELTDSILLSDGGMPLKLYENETFVVVTRHNLFKKQFEDWMEKFSHIKEDRELYNLLYADSINLPNDAMSIAQKGNLLDRLGYRIGYALRNDGCFVFNKKKRRCETQVVVLEYTTGQGKNRKYSCSKILLIDTIIWE